MTAEDDALRVLVAVSLHVAMADRELDARERGALVRAIRRQVPERSEEGAGRDIFEALTTISDDERPSLIRELAPNVSGDGLDATLECAIEIACGDDGLGDVERARLFEVAATCGFSAEEVTRRLERFAADTNRHPRTLRLLSYRD